MIDNNRKTYGAFKEWLLGQSHRKCWFSDTEALFTWFDVEHFRPKKLAKQMDGTEREGYWWLAFDWKNFRICGNVGNSQKGNFFPLKDPNRAATSQSRDVDEELPVFLDPTCQHDTTIIEFDEEGEAVASPDATAWDKERLEISVKQFRLDYGPLEKRRSEIWQECQREINRCQNAIEKQKSTPSPVARAQVQSCFERLTELVQPERQLSCVAVSCLHASELRWAMRIAASGS
ncbi:hypothetical protein [Planctomycetes bacterium K23_9]|uniref:hypothetical protein n=1 Tax=Stieleria marina TaxID=1930275 RepID=UPI0011A2F6AB